MVVDAVCNALSFPAAPLLVFEAIRRRVVGDVTCPGTLTVDVWLL